MRRSRLQCNGVHHCEFIDEELINVERYELEAEGQREILAAQREMRAADDASAEKRAILYVPLF